MKQAGNSRGESPTQPCSIMATQEHQLAITLTFYRVYVSLWVRVYLGGGRGGIQVYSPTGRQRDSDFLTWLGR
ncbi:hypothetical protein E2C01_086523 [Portunus trituberculatus]|uniref:Uncharacterized protein n=1 Tax=Portunus trituberculatus TaxID=210409 RepID=A0A5B7JAJ6_PORTR|nr:hypothetical protein [Portunus trituberculatus]